MDDPAQSRLVILLTVRAMGVVLMLAGIGIWLGGWMEGAAKAGPFIFIAGAVCSFVVPALLARRWSDRR